MAKLQTIISLAAAAVLTTSLVANDKAATPATDKKTEAKCGKDGAKCSKHEEKKATK